MTPSINGMLTHAHSASRANWYIATRETRNTTATVRALVTLRRTTWRIVMRALSKLGLGRAVELMQVKSGKQGVMQVACMRQLDRRTECPFRVGNGHSVPERPKDEACACVSAWRPPPPTQPTAFPALRARGNAHRGRRPRCDACCRCLPADCHRATPGRPTCPAPPSPAIGRDRDTWRD